MGIVTQRHDGQRARSPSSSVVLGLVETDADGSNGHQVHARRDDDRVLPSAQTWPQCRKVSTDSLSAHEDVDHIVLAVYLRYGSPISSRQGGRSTKDVSAKFDGDWLSVVRIDETSLDLCANCLVSGFQMYLMSRVSLVAGLWYMSEARTHMKTSG